MLPLNTIDRYNFLPSMYELPLIDRQLAAAVSTKYERIF